MKIEIENIGLIDYAEIKINGLTVITGENDRGKSTIGKTLFCAVKSSAMSSGRFFYRYRDNYVINKLFNDLKKIVEYNVSNNEDYKDIVKNIDDVIIAIKKISFDKKIKFHQKEKKYIEAIKKLKKNNKISNLVFFDEIYNKMIHSYSDNFKREFTAKNFESIMYYAFANDYLNHMTGRKTSKVSLEDEITGKSIVFEIGENTNFSGSKIFDNATFIDTPVIFQLISLLSDTSLSDKEYAPTIKDLKDKLIDLPQKKSIYEQDEIKNIIKKIQKTIGGDMFQDGPKFTFKKYHDPLPTQIENTATGVKAFGLLLLLLKKGYIYDKTVLILDEPEVHLHPKWQLKMAEVIVDIVEFGTRVVVNSHSPFMIEALELSCRLRDIKSNFYLIRNKGNTSDNIVELIDTSDDLSPIYETLNDSIDKLEEMSTEDFKW